MDRRIMERRDLTRREIANHLARVFAEGVKCKGCQYAQRDCDDEGYQVRRCRVIDGEYDPSNCPGVPG